MANTHEGADVVTTTPVRHRMQTALAAVSAGVHTATAKGARGYPSRELAGDGYVLRPGFLSADLAAGLRAVGARWGAGAPPTTGVDGARLRDRANRQQRDLNVRQLTGAEHLSTGLAALRESGRIESTMSALTGLDITLGALTVQIDWPDTTTKRGLHVDSHWPPTYKAFVYLTPVTGPENGPFSVVPGSHRDRARKVRAVVGNRLARRKETDVDHVYRIEDARCLLGGPGTGIFADQRLAHAGWPGHTTGTRFMLVAYLYPRGVPTPGFLG
jgi:hypothetical protein